MLEDLALQLTAWEPGFRVFQYLTLRGMLGVLTAMLIFFVFAPAMIRHFQRKQMKQPIRSDGPKSHFSKAGTPTMGGSLILISIVGSTLLWADLDNRYVWVALFTLIAFGLIGAYDDYLKLVKKNSDGLSARYKYALQSLVAMLVVIFLFYKAELAQETTLYLPFFKEVAIPMGWWFIPWSYLVIVGTSNAVNLTDGLDGLAIMPTVLVGSALGFFVYLSGHYQFAHYLHLPFLPGAGELVVFCGAIAGAGLGFLWFNTYPAQVFMGDVGSLALGAALGVLAVIVRQELVLFIMGGIFVVEAVSVIVQVASYKMTGRRVFRMAPIHHHYELLGWPEPRIIIRFWIITLILVLVGLASIKLR